MANPATTIALIGVALSLGAGKPSEVVIEWVHIGDPGNVGELAGKGAGGFGPDRICGAVDYEYRIAKYEVTNGQYITFLNAVAAVRDPHGLYKVEMAGTHDAVIAKVKKAEADVGVVSELSATLTGLRVLDNKRDTNPPRKHGNIPL